MKRPSGVAPLEERASNAAVSTVNHASMIAARGELAIELRAGLSEGGSQETMSLQSPLHRWKIPMVLCRFEFGYGVFS